MDTWECMAGFSKKAEKMKIGFDVSQIGDNKAGCGYYALGLINALSEIDSENEYIMYPTFGDVYLDPDWATTIYEISKPNFKRGLGHCNLEEARLFWQKPSDDQEVQLGRPDIVHANNFFCPTSLRTARLVYTLHDLAFLELPELTTEENRIGCFYGVFNASIYADSIIANSEYTRRHFLNIFPHYPSERIAVVYPASRFSSSPHLAHPKNLSALRAGQFWLNVGTLEPRKNQIRLLHAYAQLRRKENTFPLVFAGGTGWLMKDFETTIVDLGIEEDIVLLGYIDNASLQWLYQNCFAFVYPSIFEGFGLPVVEAMAMGAPIIASNVTALPEIVGTAGILVDPLNENQLSEALLEMQSDRALRERLSALSTNRAAQFSFIRSAMHALEIYHKTLNRTPYSRNKH